MQPRENKTHMSERLTARVCTRLVTLKKQRTIIRRKQLVRAHTLACGMDQHSSRFASSCYSSAFDIVLMYRFRSSKNYHKEKWLKALFHIWNDIFLLDLKRCKRTLGTILPFAIFDWYFIFRKRPSKKRRPRQTNLIYCVAMEREHVWFMDNITITENEFEINEIG